MTRFERLFVWTGGVLFVLSLAACAYAYAVLWASPAATAGIGAGRAIVINVLLFAVFALHHSVFARESIKQRVARVIPPGVIRAFYVWTASVLLIVVLAMWQPVRGEVYAVTGWPAVGHALVQLGGLWLIARSVARIDPLELAGIKPATRVEALQIAGPYRFVRHPLYLGWLLVVFGAAHMTGNRLAFAAISTAYLLIAIPWEERSLRHAFGTAYTDYQHAVRWRVVPFVY
jgi:protein-S-isoprenylcysteine O-methyltransferase Ste14